MKGIGRVFAQIRALPDEARAWIATGSFMAAATIGSITYTHYSFWFFKRHTSFMPDLMSGIIAAFVVLPLIRGELLHAKRLDRPTILSLVLLFYLLSMFAKMGLQGTSLAGIFTESPTFILLLFIGLAANFNPHRYGEIALLAAIVIGGYNISTVSAVMGFNGWLFVILIAAGTLLTLDLSKLWSKP